MPSINCLLREGIRQLKEAGVPSPSFDARELLLHALGLSSRADLYRFTEADDRQAQAYWQLIARRAKRYPLQYLLGFWEFYGRRFIVREGVLIPRADTECLVEAALQRADMNGPILDLCSGSGALAITLALEAGAFSDALELSPAALEVLRENVRLHTEAGVQVIAADVLCYQPKRSYALITCNPPYISETEYTELQPEVLYEPKMALVAGHDGLAFYEAVTRRYRPFLLPGGLLLFEVGAGQAPAVLELLAEAGYRRLFTHPDIQGISRVVGGYRE